MIYENILYNMLYNMYTHKNILECIGSNIVIVLNNIFSFQKRLVCKYY